MVILSPAIKRELGVRWFGADITGNIGFITVEGTKVQCNFEATQGQDVKLANALMFPVPAGTTISSFKIGRDNSNAMTINLEGEEVVHFAENGTYVINSLLIKMGGQ